MTNIFERVVCGVDDSEAGALAAHVAARVTDPNGSLLLLSAEDASIAVHAGFGYALVAAHVAEEARDALDRGETEARPLHVVHAKLVKGDPLRNLLAEIERRSATLAVVGSHGLPRTAGIALGSVATHLLHEAPCPVLVVRGSAGDASWPRSIVVGVDGSAQSAAAYAAARALHERFGGSLRAMVATDAYADVEAARQIAPDVELHTATAIDALVVASEHAGLVVVGSRGLRGIRALASVSERLGHEAECSVLVVRPSAPPDAQ
jgi:nucleotide-binding universal stress UspA family protein